VTLLQSGTRRGEPKLKSAWFSSAFTSASWHPDRGDVAVFLCQPVIVVSSQQVDWWRWKGNVSGGTWRAYSGSSHRDTTKEDCSGDSNRLGQSESVLRRTSEWGSQHSGGLGYFRSEGKQRVVPTDESRSLHVEKSMPGLWSPDTTPGTWGNDCQRSCYGCVDSYTFCASDLHLGPRQWRGANQTHFVVTVSKRFEWLAHGTVSGNGGARQCCERPIDFSALEIPEVARQMLRAHG